MLKKHCPRYKKSADVYDQLADKQKRALDHAAKLRKHHKDTGDDEHANPSTGVDRLVRSLNALPAGTPGS